MPLYVFDERFVELSGFPGYEREGPEARTRLCGFWRTGAFRARCALLRSPSRVARQLIALERRFLVEGVYDMRNSLRQRGSDLLLRFGKMEKVTTEVVKALITNGDEVREVFLQKEVRLLSCWLLANCG